jgi:hypothetical protein
MQALGATDVLRKPAPPREVVAAVSRYCTDKVPVA